VAWLYFADRLMEFPPALLGVALGTVLLPSLVKRHAESDPKAYSHLIDWGMRLALLLALPAALGLAMLALPLVATLFWHGEFTQASVRMTRLALIAYSVGLGGSSS
jgi:putative peptidoglycan lipid II flippase